MPNPEIAERDDLTPAERVYADYSQWFAQTPPSAIRDPFLRGLIFDLWGVVKNEVEGGK
jgi:hypothetical protein